MAAATSSKRPPARAPKRRKMFTPPTPDIVVVQPPAHLAHLTGDDLFEALTTDRSEKWYSARAAAEVGRERPTFSRWVSNRYGYDAAVKAAKEEADRTGTRPRPVKRPKDRMMAPPDGYDTRSPWWYAGTVRRWAHKEKLMRRDGTFVPYKPTGRSAGSTNSVKREGEKPMQEIAREVLAACDALREDGKSLAQARTILADRYQVSERQIDRRLSTARKLAAENDDLKITDAMTADEVHDRIRKARALLAADGRRRNESKIRQGIADRLGIGRETVDAALDTAPADPALVS